MRLSKPRVDALLSQGARAYMMMIEPGNVPITTRAEADTFMAGYKQKQREWQAMFPNANKPAF